RANTGRVEGVLDGEGYAVERPELGAPQHRRFGRAGPFLSVGRLGHERVEVRVEALDPVAVLVKGLDGRGFAPPDPQRELGRVDHAVPARIALSVACGVIASGSTRSSTKAGRSAARARSNASAKSSLRSTSSACAP